MKSCLCRSAPLGRPSRLRTAIPEVPKWDFRNSHFGSSGQECRRCGWPPHAHAGHGRQRSGRRVVVDSFARSPTWWASLDGNIQIIARRIVQILPQTQIPLGRRKGGVAQGELDLIEFGAALVREFGIRAPQVVRRNR